MPKICSLLEQRFPLPPTSSLKAPLVIIPVLKGDGLIQQGSGVPQISKPAEGG
jgi:hypothetical protein